MSDLIERQAAIDALKQQAETMSEWSNRYAEQRKGVLTAVNIVEDLPSAQLEIEESLYRYKCFITDTEGLQHEVVHVGDIRRVTGWEI